MFNIGDKLTKENYTQGAIWCNNNNAMIDVLDEEYIIVAVPEPAPLTYEEIDAMRVAYRQAKIDDKTIARMRKQANGTWTEEDEKAYLELDAEVTAYIEENYPYPESDQVDDKLSQVDTVNDTVSELEK